METRHLGMPAESAPHPRRATTSPLQAGLPWVIELRIVGTASTIQVQVHETMIIGRGDLEQGIIPAIDLGPFGGHAQGVSRQHAVILAKDNRILIKDLNSVNGTRLNGYVLPANEEHKLRHGDELTIGQLRLQVRFAVVPTYDAPPTDPQTNQVTIPVVGRGENVLVVEDDADVASVFRITLEHAGYKVTVMTNGVTALGALTHKFPDAVVLDLMLPDMDGLDLVHYVRKQPNGQKVPLIVVSGATGGFQMNKSLEAGVNTFLGKPVKVDELVNAVSALVTPGKQSAPILTT